MALDLLGLAVDNILCAVLLRHSGMLGYVKGCSYACSLLSVIMPASCILIERNGCIFSCSDSCLACGGMYILSVVLFCL